MSNKAIKAARDILKKFGSEIPIDIKAIVEAHNILVHYEALEGTVSGVLMIQEDQLDMAVNSNHIPGRQRFTMAHELGHYLLHGEEKKVFVDESPPFFRDPKAAYGIYQKEVEANTFAAELLMPEEILRKEIGTKPLKAKDKAALERMAARFGVSPKALNIRLSNLGLVNE